MICLVLGMGKQCMKCYKCTLASDFVNDHQYGTSSATKCLYKISSNFYIIESIFTDWIIIMQKIDLENWSVLIYSAQSVWESIFTHWLSKIYVDNQFSLNNGTRWTLRIDRRWWTVHNQCLEKSIFTDQCELTDWTKYLVSGNPTDPVFGR